MNEFKTLILVLFFVLGNVNFSFGQAQIECDDFVISGAIIFGHDGSWDPDCVFDPPIPNIGIWASFDDSIHYSFVQNVFSITLTVGDLNDNDFFTIETNSSSSTNIDLVGSCTEVNGNTIGPFFGPFNSYGDIKFNVSSATPFNEILLVNIGGPSGIISGECPSVEIVDCSFNLGMDTTICEGDELILDTGYDNVSYQWQNGSNDPVFIANQEGIYWVELNTDFCSYIDTIEISFYENPAIDLGEDVFFCSGQSFELNAFFEGATYQWQDNSNDSNFIVSDEGSYWVDVSNECITVSDSIDFTVVPPPNGTLGQDTSICPGESIILSLEAMNASYQWNDNSMNSELIASAEGIYSVWVQNQCGELVDSILVTWKNLPNLDLGSDTTLCFEESILLDAFLNNAQSYQWQDGSNTASLLAQQEGIYSVIVSVDDCEISDAIQLNYELCGLFLSMPNVFSPNGDGKNDFFQPLVSNEVSQMETKIYNRWGAIIFESSDPELKWDGKDFNGNDIASGTYFYFITYSGLDGVMETLSGDVMLLRE